MTYHVETFMIKTGAGGRIKKEKIDSLLAAKLNQMAAAGAEIISVCPLLVADKNFDYQIIYKK